MVPKLRASNVPLYHTGRREGVFPLRAIFLPAHPGRAETRPWPRRALCHRTRSAHSDIPRFLFQRGEPG